jgi:hypothetical protein
VSRETDNVKGVLEFYAQLKKLPARRESGQYNDIEGQELEKYVFLIIYPSYRFKNLFEELNNGPDNEDLSYMKDVIGYDGDFNHK